MTKNIYELPKTETISYFNENEWNKDLSIEERELDSLVYESYQNEIDSWERGYGPCSGSTVCRFEAKFEFTNSRVWYEFQTDEDNILDVGGNSVSWNTRNIVARFWSFGTLYSRHATSITIRNISQLRRFKDVLGEKILVMDVITLSEMENDEKIESQIIEKINELIKKHEREGNISGFYYFCF